MVELEEVKEKKMKNLFNGLITIIFGVIVWIVITKSYVLNIFLQNLINDSPPYKPPFIELIEKNKQP